MHTLTWLLTLFTTTARLFLLQDYDSVFTILQRRPAEGVDPFSVNIFNSRFINSAGTEIFSSEGGSLVLDGVEIVDAFVDSIGAVGEGGVFLIDNTNIIGSSVNVSAPLH